MKDNVQNILRDIQIAKLIYYKNCFFLFKQSCEPPTQPAEKVTLFYHIRNQCTKLQTKPEYAQLISTSSEQRDGYLTFATFTKSSFSLHRSYSSQYHYISEFGTYN